ncbi:MAG TPA: hypothetical protein VGP40_03965, partial [Chthoniobacterales bacterium]|nr:hypothetical protein [Chthoniobacterales bacterium]
NESTGTSADRGACQGTATMVSVVSVRTGVAGDNGSSTRANQSTCSCGGLARVQADQADGAERNRCQMVQFHSHIFPSSLNRLPREGRSAAPELSFIC